MKKYVMFFLLMCVSVLAFGQDQPQVVEPFPWKDFLTEVIGIALAIVAVIGRFFIKGSKADILEWIKKALNFVLDFLPAKQADGKINGVGEPYKE